MFCVFHRWMVACCPELGHDYCCNPEFCKYHQLPHRVAQDSARSAQTLQEVVPVRPCFVWYLYFFIFIHLVIFSLEIFIFIYDILCIIFSQAVSVKVCLYKCGCFDHLNGFLIWFCSFVCVSGFWNRKGQILLLWQIKWICRSQQASPQTAPVTPPPLPPPAPPTLVQRYVMFLMFSTCFAPLTLIRLIDLRF